MIVVVGGITVVCGSDEIEEESVIELVPSDLVYVVGVDVEFEVEVDMNEDEYDADMTVDDGNNEGDSVKEISPPFSPVRVEIEIEGIITDVAELDTIELDKTK